MFLPKLKKGSVVVAPMLGMVLTHGAHAQTDAAVQIDDGDQATEVIRVTGSRIRQIDMETASSVTVFSREDLDRSGYATVADFLRNSVPSGAMFSENETLSQIGGSSSFGGRDFGSSYTLVLLNGRRLPINAIAADFVDLNLIPMAAVERVEYLTDGASAIYGSDAIAGVLNIITRKSFDGVSVSSRIGTSEMGGGTETSWQVVSGASSSRSNFLVAADYFKREPVEAVDRPLIKSAIAPDGTEGRSPNGFPGYVILADGSIAASDLFPECADVDDIGRCYYDVGPDYQAIPKSERQSIYTVFDYRLNDSLELFGEARYSRAFTLGSNGAAPGGVSLSPNTPFNDSEEAITVVRRYVDFGPRVRENTNEAFSTVAGVRGEIGFDHQWTFEAASHRLRNLQVGAGGQINSPAAIEAFESGVLNPFEVNVFDTEDKLDAYNRINTTTFREGVSILQTYSFAIDGLTPLELPGGNMAYATGIEFRKERFNDRSDNLSKEDRIIGSASSDGRGARENEAIFLELALPVREDLDLTTAARYDNIDNNHQATTYKLGVAYAPTQALKLRATVGTGFKAADMHQLYLGTSFGFNTASDAATCQNQPSCQIATISGGNPELEPETSEFYNLGVVAQLSENFSMSADYWDISIDNKVSTLPLQAILNDPERFGDLIFRNEAGRLVDGGFVRTNLQNLNQETSAGVEVKLNHVASTNFGQFSTGLILNAITKSKTQNTAADPLCDLSNTVKGPDVRLTSRWASGAFGSQVAWRHYAARDSYAGGFTPGTCDRVDPDSKFGIKPSNEIDLNLTYTAPFETQLGFGINNLTNAEPAFDRNATWPWYNQQRYSNMGRFYYLSATHEFR